MDVFLKFIREYPELIDVLQIAAILATGICAVWAGSLGFKGAKAQADALAEIHRTERQEKFIEQQKIRETNAATLAAELTAMSRDMIQIRSHAKNFLAGPITQHRPLRALPIDCDDSDIDMGINFMSELINQMGSGGKIFMHDPTVIAAFNPVLATRVVRAYYDYEDNLRGNNHIVQTCKRSKDYLYNGAMEVVIENCSDFLTKIGTIIFDLMVIANIDDAEFTIWKEWATEKGLIRNQDDES